MYLKGESMVRMQQSMETRRINSFLFVSLMYIMIVFSSCAIRLNLDGDLANHCFQYTEEYYLQNISYVVERSKKRSIVKYAKRHVNYKVIYLAFDDKHSQYLVSLQKGYDILCVKLDTKFEEVERFELFLDY